ncbi:hypothetical protein DFA_08629 [Cavenderia fasciculata]|uniref:tRNA/rRNA methyltransferase SpoU type domain-containing protein n=1 Tax=Cavenderia fasciculata TaxID=261658 RepID=F4Q3C3_CACFS|nr:uncharacterized protein DFA_08629 [Cavenderia fasciculata]EGG17633.1 hypothetical protein DFA_08629 [Cavenderia fasciculata]|eukprot:XP_004356117.1 hypothetical protein DFA_08629 [Cavenderia fasciculata]
MYTRTLISSISKRYTSCTTTTTSSFLNRVIIPTYTSNHYCTFQPQQQNLIYQQQQLEVKQQQIQQQQQQQPTTTTTTIEDELITQCIDVKCAIHFKVPSKLSGKEGHCPQCGSKQPFKKHTSNYRRLLAKKHKEYSEQLVEITKTSNTLDLVFSNNLSYYPLDEPYGLGVLLVDCRSLANIGSVFRTSDGAGFNHVYLCGITGTPPRNEILKTSLGAEEFVNWSYCHESLHCIKELKRKGVKIIAIEQSDKSIPLLESLDYLYENTKINNNQSEQQQQHSPICVVFGNEIVGLSEEIIKECDFICDLPMKGQKRSLNISVAFGITSYVLSEKFKNIIVDNHLGIEKINPKDF